MISVASLAGVLASMTLLGVLIWVIGIALLGYVTAQRGPIAVAVVQAMSAFALASLVFVGAVVAIEFGVSGAWIGPRTAEVGGGGS
jgi:membrane protein DedA with SNARE-associated domain